MNNLKFSSQLRLTAKRYRIFSLCFFVASITGCMFMAFFAVTFGSIATNEISDLSKMLNNTADKITTINDFNFDSELSVYNLYNSIPDITLLEKVNLLMPNVQDIPLNMTPEQISDKYSKYYLEFSERYFRSQLGQDVIFESIDERFGTIPRLDVFHNKTNLLTDYSISSRETYEKINKHLTSYISGKYKDKIEKKEIEELVYELIFSSFMNKTLTLNLIDSANEKLKLVDFSMPALGQEVMQTKNKIVNLKETIKNLYSNGNFLIISLAAKISVAIIALTGMYYCFSSYRKFLDMSERLDNIANALTLSEVTGETFSTVLLCMNEGSRHHSTETATNQMVEMMSKVMNVRA